MSIESVNEICAERFDIRAKLEKGMVFHAFDRDCEVSQDYLLVDSKQYSGNDLGVFVEVFL